jgi:hypothetical protein
MHDQSCEDQFDKERSWLHRDWGLEPTYFYLIGLFNLSIPWQCSLAGNSRSDRCLTAYR